jgi:hypothetical protein
MSEPSKPTRIQRRRTAGWSAPDGALYVGRPSVWSNSWRVGDTGHTVLPGGWIDRRPHEPLTQQQAVDSYRNARTHDIEYLRRIREQLAGKTLMCWCKVGDPCHGDWLLLVANSPLPLQSFVDTTPKEAAFAAPSDVEPRQDAQ